MLQKLINALRLRFRKRRYREGTTVALWLASDLRRDVEVIDASEIEDGFVTARVRTWCIPLSVKRNPSEPEFSEPQRLRIDDLEDLRSTPWGKLLPP